MRRIILHYHLFKNAGSSVDRILAESYGDKWRNFDRSEPGLKISAAHMQEYLESHPELKAVSSHQAVPPVPVGDFEILPLIFLRDPIARIRSAWSFEWQKQLGLKKPKGTLAEYVTEKLGKGKGRVIADFQVFRLSNHLYNEVKPGTGIHEMERLERAMDFVRNLEFFGIVEKFEESLSYLRHCSSDRFPELDCKVYRENVSQAESPTMKQTHNQLKRAIGDDLYQEVLIRNKLDMQLHSYACGLFDERIKQCKHQLSLEPFNDEILGMVDAQSEDSDQKHTSRPNDPRPKDSEPEDPESGGQGPSIAA